jgi:hypothetical protein
VFRQISSPANIITTSIKDEPKAWRAMSGQICLNGVISGSVGF